MNLFDNNSCAATLKQYEAEAKQRWGNTEAYKESVQKTSCCSEEKMNGAIAGLNAIFGEFSAVLRSGKMPESEAAQALVDKLQAYVTDNFYTCTPEILKGLGQVYVADDRFKTNIDQNGTGTAEFTSKAIEYRCK